MMAFDGMKSTNGMKSTDGIKISDIKKWLRNFSGQPIEVYSTVVRAAVETVMVGLAASVLEDDWTCASANICNIFSRFRFMIDLQVLRKFGEIFEVSRKFGTLSDSLKDYNFFERLRKS